MSEHYWHEQVYLHIAQAGLIGQTWLVQTSLLVLMLMVQTGLLESTLLVQTGLLESTLLAQTGLVQSGWLERTASQTVTLLQAKDRKPLLLKLQFAAWLNKFNEIDIFSVVLQFDLMTLTIDIDIPVFGKM